MKFNLTIIRIHSATVRVAVAENTSYLPNDCKIHEVVTGGTSGYRLRYRANMYCMYYVALKCYYCRFNNID